MKSKPMAVCYESTEPPERALMRIAGLADALGAHAVVIGGRDLLMPAGDGIGPIDLANRIELVRNELGRASGPVEECGLVAGYQVASETADVVLGPPEEREGDMVVVESRLRGIPRLLVGGGIGVAVGLLVGSVATALLALPS